MLELCTLASGSSGNCMLVTDGETHLLVDAGISARRICQELNALDLTPDKLSGILITHEHSDHISGLTTLLRRFPVPVYASGGTGLQLTYRIAFINEVLHTFRPGERFSVGSVEVGTFATSHDAAESVGFTLSSGGRKAAVATDLGYVTEAVLSAVTGAHLLVAETNHDEEWVRESRYPYSLKRRILGDQGHLSNGAGAELVRRCVEAGTTTAVLAHLSSENNTPQLAHETVCRTLTLAGIDPERDILLEVAPRNQRGRRYRV